MAIMAATISRFIVSPAVCSATDKDGSTILHIERDKFYSVIGIGSLIWAKLTASPQGLTLATIVESLSHEFKDVPCDQIKGDVERLITGFRENGLLQSDAEQPHRLTQTLRSWVFNWFMLLTRNTTVMLLKLKLYALAAFFGLAAVNLILKLISFSAFYHIVKQWPMSSKRPDLEVTQRVCDGVDEATTWYPKQAMCLQRSAVATCLLRSCGLPAQMVIGCRKIPFKSHAWTELYGLVVNDKNKVQEFYTVLDRC
jgi:Transglutaminase-like superfamily/Coenzyme PQQ synthesis protein D (PqqD)